jgi:hypothetical protein
MVLALLLVGCQTVDSGEVDPQTPDAGTPDTTSSPGVDPLAIFNDQFVNGWNSAQSWMSSITVDSGALHLRSVNAWEALQLNAPRSIAATAYGSLTFRAKGSGTLRVEGPSSTMGHDLTLTADWTAYDVPIGLLTTTPFEQLYLKNTVAAQEIWVDDIAFSPAAQAGDSYPTHPIPYTKNNSIAVDSGTINYVYVPTSYDDTHRTPTKLLVWLHGCTGHASGDVWVVSPGGSQSWITLAVGGEEGGCWDMNNDPAVVLAAIADLKTHFNIDPKRIILGGYSSGGDLTYRMDFYYASMFAGILVENTSPFRDTGSSQSASLAAASWRFNVVHLAHLQDDTYPIAGVRAETDAMTQAGFPLLRLEHDGGHSDSTTNPDLLTYLLPHMDDGWTAP